jgi:hypothetical protein
MQHGDRNNGLRLQPPQVIPAIQHDRFRRAVLREYGELAPRGMVTAPTIETPGEPSPACVRNE